MERRLALSVGVQPYYTAFLRASKSGWGSCMRLGFLFCWVFFTLGHLDPPANDFAVGNCDWPSSFCLARSLRSRIDRILCFHRTCVNCAVLEESLFTELSLQVSGWWMAEITVGPTFNGMRCLNLFLHFSFHRWELAMAERVWAVPLETLPPKSPSDCVWYPAGCWAV